MESYNCCFCFGRRFEQPELRPPGAVGAMFTAYADAGGGIGPDGLRRFLVDVQGVTAAAAAAEAERILQVRPGPPGDLAASASASPSPAAGSTKATGRLAAIGRRVTRRLSAAAFALPSPGLSLEEFYHYLFDDELNPPIRSEVHQDMTAPLSHYFIFTGHNSYLTGNQINSQSSDIPIISSLERGVRVIELDIWPNSTKDNVAVLHGWTLTAPVDFLKCLKSIKAYAFVASNYPLVLTLEDHLTPDLQAKAAEMLVGTFGDLLFIPPSDPPKQFASPEELKNKIIISTKPPKEYLNSMSIKSTNSGKMTDLPETDTPRKCDAEELEDKDKEDSEEEEDPKFLPNTAPQYRQIITIQAGKPKGHLGDALKVDPEKVKRLSLSETQLSKAATSHSADLVRFTQKNIVRIYPRGTRIKSTNYEPFLAWTHGAQMVAFNMQGHDSSLRLMQGFFKANGGCGYVKKPDFLMKNGPNGEVFDPKGALPVKMTLKVAVYTGDGWRVDFSKTHFDAFSPPDFYTKVGIVGVQGDTITMRTAVAQDKWVPVWEEEFAFPLRAPELAVLRIEVQEYDVNERPDFGGQTCLPVSELRQGIRAVPLYDQKGNKYKSVRLLMRFDIVHHNHQGSSHHQGSRR